MLTSNQLQRLSAACSAAVICEQTTGLPAEITIAQWALESGWGNSAPGNNCFGIKPFQGCKVQTFPTWEVVHGVREHAVLEFAAFDSLAACFEKHAELITTERSYAQAWAHFQAGAGLDTLIAEVAPIYATDPSYSNQLRRILAMPEVQAVLKLVRSQLSCETAQNPTK